MLSIDRDKRGEEPGAKIIDIALARAVLRPPEPGSLAATLQNIETAFSEARRQLANHTNG
jgi:hypothetical protein